MGRGEASRVFELEEVERFGIDFDSDIYARQESNRARNLITKTLIAIDQNDEKEISQLFGLIVRTSDHSLFLEGGEQEQRFTNLLNRLIVLRTKLRVGDTGIYVTNRLAQLSVYPPSPYLTSSVSGGDGRIHARLKASDRKTLCGKEIRWENFVGQHALARDERYSDRFDLCMECATSSRKHPDSLALNKALWEKVMSVEEYQAIMREVAIDALNEKAKETFSDINEFRGYVDALLARLQLQTLEHGADVLLALDEKERLKRLFSTAGLQPTEATLVRQLRAAVRNHYPQSSPWPSKRKLIRLMEKSLVQLVDESMVYNHAPAFVIGGAIYPLAFKEVVEKKCQEIGGQHDLGFAYKYFQKEIAHKL